MRSIIYILFLTLLPFLSCSLERERALKQTSFPKTEDVPVKNGNSMLWIVEGDGIKTSYLFGTMHLINETYFHLSDALKNRIIQSESIIMELNGMPNPLKAFELMSLEKGHLSDHFSKEQFIIILQFMEKEFNLSPQDFDQFYGKMKPFVLLQAIAQTYFEPSARSYDLEIMGLAHANTVPLIGLETIEEQLGFFEQISQEEMAEMVIAGLTDFEQEKKNTLQLMKVYAKQKVAKLIPLIKKQSPEFMEFSALFLTDRNKRWIPKLVEEMEIHHCFTAVGAAHLFGEDGIIELLKAKGYKLTAISTL